MADTRPRFLLLVPPPPRENTLAAYKKAFASTLSDVLKEVALQSQDCDGAAILEIALACPQLVRELNSPRASLYDELQVQIALLYKLVAIIAARDSIDVEDDQGVDVRVIPVAWAADETVVYSPSYGPLVTISALAQSDRVWQYAFGVESAEGEKMVKAFVNAKSSSVDAPSQASPERQPGQHHDVAVGGTFDHLHIGHKLLLTMTLIAADPRPGNGSHSVTIGITGDALLKNKKYAEVLESWETRQRKIEDFCDSLLDFTSWPSRKTVDHQDSPEPNGKSFNLQYSNGLEVRCTQIQDPFGPTITDESISALVISAETRSGGNAVNEKRREKGWTELQVFEVDVLDADEDGTEQVGFEAKLSSTAIRQKLASRTG